MRFNVPKKSIFQNNVLITTQYCKDKKLLAAIVKFYRENLQIYSFPSMHTDCCGIGVKT